MSRLSLPVFRSPLTDPDSDGIVHQTAQDLKHLNIGSVRFGYHDRQLYSTDASLYQVMPIGVVIPDSIDRIPTLVRYAAEHRVCLLPRGGGTSLAGQCTNASVVIDFSPTCRKVLDLDVSARTVTVEPGIGIDELNRELGLRKVPLFFAPDPATSNQCTIGGCIGNNAAGARSIRYGRTSENIAGIEIVLGSGEQVWLEPGAGRRSEVALRLAEQVAEVVRKNASEIRKRFPKLIRRNAGYELDPILDQLERGVTPADLDLSKLICGSEGTLGIVTRAKLLLHPLPLARGLAVVSFRTVEDAIDAVVSIVRTGPSAVELLDDSVIRAALGNTECRRYVQMLPRVDGQTPQAVLYVEYQIEEQADRLVHHFDQLRSVVKDSAIETYEDPSAMNLAWTLRKASEALLHGLPGHAKPITFVEDNSVPIENLKRFVSGFKEIVARHGTEAAYYAHASVGVLHVRPMIDLHSPHERDKMRSIAVEVAKLAQECGGVMSGEHGDGRVRSPLLESFYGPAITSAFQQIKQIFDPAGILNPGNIVGAGPIESITQNLRLDAQKSPNSINQIDTYFEYPGEEGFNGALELCNGAGFCRKTAGGVMCPSYRATLDERHSTRGRANAVRVAVTHSAQPDWNNTDVYETLNLCLSCKACKTECPSNVDIAQLKAEYYAQSYRASGRTPLSARLIGHVRTLNRLASLTPEWANRIARFRPVRALANRVMNLHPNRSLPTFSPSLYRWFHRKQPRTSEKPKVALWPDCFMTYNEPGIGIAATTVLEAFGYHVDLPPGGCCGRAMISTGLLSDAVRTADTTLEIFRPIIEDDTVQAIVVFEPSCLSAIQDEWLKLKLKSPRPLREKLAKKAVLIEQFIESSWSDHPLHPEIRPMTNDILLHGHCHQKALWGEQITLDLLRRLTTGQVRAIASTCCGMAGAFGYTRDRYDLSMRIGELSVFPAVREAKPETVLCVPGTSCRHQIHDGTGRKSFHPVEILARTLHIQSTVPSRG